MVGQEGTDALVGQGGTEALVGQEGTEGSSGSAGDHLWEVKEFWCQLLDV